MLDLISLLLILLQFHLYQFFYHHVTYAQIEPSSGGKLGYDNAREASYLVLATSAPVSMKQQTCSVPPRMFSYAVTLLGRVSRSLADIIDQRTLLGYLSYCSTFTFVSASEFFKMEEHHLEEGDVQLSQRCEFSKYHIWWKLQLKEAESSLLHFQVEHKREINCVNIILQVVIDIWPSLKLGLIDEVTRTLRLQFFSSYMTTLNTTVIFILFIILSTCRKSYDS